jgi:hypothetical protein
MLVVLKTNIAGLETYGSGLDRVERQRVNLLIAQQKARAAWVEVELSAMEGDREAD